MTYHDKLKHFQKTINYQFKKPKLLTKALTHSSYSNESKKSKFENNERLEFLGDAVLEIIISDFLFKNYPKMLEGELTKFRASIVCEPTLANFAGEIELADCIKLGKGEENSGGRFRASVLSDTVEALIGAIYLDGGLESAKDFISNTLLKNIENRKLFIDSKTNLQEIMQRNGEYIIEYAVVNEIGPDHNKLFEVAIKHDKNIIGHGRGRSKKLAEQDAAFNVIKKLNINIQ